VAHLACLLFGPRGFLEGFCDPGGGVALLSEYLLPSLVPLISTGIRRWYRPGTRRLKRLKIPTVKPTPDHLLSLLGSPLSQIDRLPFSFPFQKHLVPMHSHFSVKFTSSFARLFRLQKRPDRSLLVICFLNAESATFVVSVV
jgi:hypothetical protein